MSVLPFIPKENPDVPDHWKMKINYITGKQEDFDVVKQEIQKEILMFMTKDELINWVPVSSILRIEFNKDFTRTLEGTIKHDYRQQSPSGSV